MEEESSYVVEITPEAEIYYLQLIEYLYSTHSPESAQIKSDEILDLAMSLDKLRDRGTPESKLDFLGENIDISFTGNSKKDRQDHLHD